MIKNGFVKLLMVLMIGMLILGGCSTPADSSGSTAGESSSTATETSADSGSTLDRSKYFITVATGPTSGLYYPIGGAFSSVFQNKLGYKSSAQSTGASVENINLILNSDAELAITMSDSVAQAYSAFGAFEDKEPASNLRALMGLYPNYVQLVTTDKTGITKFEDLKGKRVGVGAPNSGVELNARMMYEAHGMSYEDSEVDYLNYGEAIDQMKNNLVDAVFVTSGIPNATVMELGTVANIVVVPIEGEGLKNLITKYPFFVEATIPSDVYGTTTDVTTATVRNLLLVREDLPEDVVYDLTKGIFDNISDIKASHATAEKHISLENALIGVDIPLHPGALKYYEEQGIK
ncbi:TAXI family TRAP transporter solute-binding subunit [Fusibacter paucivorans]|uniref:TAXI family TRAP transporter solute-binding subunit n=1 Tax=Fusibacter paucivorans TaxID=76009 RepID=A0ABS5PU43_9FIRM|nr:TAXI family TRAP transporter solute-binding subunit [Fusibacter paucivorans]MBS7528611.1 TAXI family TRAP transporter solute-binding subunit [Fusibacter paucivorans]